MFLHRLIGQDATTDPKSPKIDIEYLLRLTDAEKLDGGPGDPAKEVAIGDYVYAQLSAEYSGLLRSQIRFKEEARHLWSVSVNYEMNTVGAPSGDKTGGTADGSNPPATQPSTPGANDDLDETYSFSTVGGTEHITLSLKCLDFRSRKGANGDPLPPTKSLKDLTIGANGEGVDRIMGNLKFSMQKKIDNIDPAYVKTINRLTGTVNRRKWYNFEPGELLFAGASGQKKAEEAWSVTFEFLCSPNLATVIISSDNPDTTDNESLYISGKRGWDYIWVAMDQVENESGSVLKKIPRTAYVEQIYYYSDFALLRIGASTGVALTQAQVIWIEDAQV